MNGRGTKVDHWMACMVVMTLAVIIAFLLVKLIQYGSILLTGMPLW